MERKAVESSQIVSIGYDAGARKLHVEFKSYNPAKPNSLYEYENVGPEVHEQLMRTTNDDGSKFSVGRYFGETIKANAQKYPYKRLEQKKS